MIEQGQSPREKVIALIELQDRLWVRVAAVREGDEWHDALLEVVSGAEPPRWTEQRWNYDNVIFVARVADGASVGEWLRAEQAIVDDLTIKLPTIHDQLSWERHASSAQIGYEILPWPMTKFDLAWEPLKKGPGSGSLIAEGSPSFLRFATAAACFFGVNLDPSGSMDHLRSAFHHQDLSGRIVKVHIKAADVEVDVEGSALNGMTVELASDVPGPSKVLSDEPSQAVHFALAEGMPANAWVVLKVGADWLDRKFLNWPHTIYADSGIEVVVEPMTELQELVSGGEGSTVEFKRELPTTGSKGNRNFLRTVSAFANGEGGAILFGVADDGEVVGLSREGAAPKTQDAITNLVRTVVAPLPLYSIATYDVEDRPEQVVLVLTVKPGASPPYGVEPGNPSYYVRRGATTFPASADQVRALARSRPPADQVNASPYRAFRLS